MSSGGLIGRHLLSVVYFFILGSLVHAHLHAQAWDDRAPNVLTARFSGNFGGLGVAYRRQLPSVPLSLGAGFGVLGPAYTSI